MARTVDPEQHRLRRAQIVDAALGLFATKGFAATTTADICRAAGVSTGSLFHYFPSKQAVFQGMWEFDRAEAEEQFAAAQADPDPWTVLMRMVDEQAAAAAEPIMAGLLVEIISHAHRDVGFAAALAESDRRLMAGVADLVRRLREAGRIDPGLPDLEAARWVLTLNDSFLGRGYPEPDRDVRAAVATTKQLIARVLRLRDPQRSVENEAVVINGPG
ncbi:MAG TPA: TetR/AcrR family transcriptional regulator [Pseudonocardia sp.]|nr:TetR/AcrR family transcriptional regulator [Pseudonocardia sp.]